MVVVVGGFCVWRTDYHRSAFGFNQGLDLVIAAMHNIVFWLAIVMLLAACANEHVVYQPLPAWVIPKAPELPIVKSEELQCISDDAYVRLVTRERLRANDQALLRSLLGVSDD